MPPPCGMQAPPCLLLLHQLLSGLGAPRRPHHPLPLPPSPTLMPNPGTGESTLPAGRGWAPGAWRQVSAVWQQPACSWPAAGSCLTSQTLLLGLAPPAQYACQLVLCFKRKELRPCLGPSNGAGGAMTATGRTTWRTISARSSAAHSHSPRPTFLLPAVVLLVVCWKTRCCWGLWKLLFRCCRAAARRKSNGGGGGGSGGRRVRKPKSARRAGGGGGGKGEGSSSAEEAEEECEATQGGQASSRRGARRRTSSREGEAGGAGEEGGRRQEKAARKVGRGGIRAGS